MKNFTLLSIAIISTTLIFSSCSENKKTDNDDESVISEIKRRTVKDEVSELVYPLPTSFELTNMLNEIGAAYILSLSNPVENAEKYLTVNSKAFNLGVYGADLSYASTYKQKQITIDYMSASNKLIEELGLTSAIEDSIITKIEANQDNKDALINIISTSFYDTYKYLNKNERGELALLILTGSWLEGLYICTHISEDTFNDVNMIKIIMNQKEPLSKLVSLLDQYSEKEFVAELITDLTDIKSVYDTMEQGSITAEQITSITQKVDTIRTKYTE